MDNNKKINMFLFLPFFLTLFLFIFSVNTFAMTDNEFITFFDKVLENEPYKSFGVTSQQYLNGIKSVIKNYQDFNHVFMSFPTNQGINRICIFIDDVAIHGGYSGRLYWKKGQEVPMTGYAILFNSDGSVYSSSSFVKNENTYNFSTGVIFQSDYNIYTSYFVYNSNFTDETSYTYHNLSVLDTITLSAFSGKKFTFNDKNQLNVTLTGTYTTSDFSFYVQKLNDGSWENFSTDYYVLSNYQNPYYVVFNNLNYFPAGTYRYVADYRHLGTQLFYSNEFEIFSNVINNPTTGTVDDGNINIDIDSGETVDNIKDFLGSQPDFDGINVTGDDINNAIGVDDLQNSDDERVSPYSLFILTFIDGLSNALLSTGKSEDFTFKVHTWGKSYTISPSDVIPTYNAEMTSFMRTMSTIVIGFVIIKWVQKIIETLSEADMGKVLELVEEKYSNLL